MGNGAITVSQIDADAHPVMELSVVPEVQAKMLEYSRQCRQREAAAQRMAPPVRRPGHVRKVKMSTAQTAVEPPPHKLAAGSGFAMAKWRNGRSQVPATPQAQITPTSSTCVAGASDPAADSTKPPSASATPEVLTKSAEEMPSCPTPRQVTDFQSKPSVCPWFAPVRLLPRKAANEEAAVKPKEMVAQSPSAQQEAAKQELSADSGALAVTTRSTLREVYASCSQELARSPRGLQPSDDSDVPPAATPFRKLASVASWLPHLDCVEEEAHNDSLSSKQVIGAGPAVVMQVEHGCKDVSVGAMVAASIVARTVDSDGLDSSAEAAAVEALLRDEGMTSRVEEAPQPFVPAPPSSPVKGSFRRSRLQRGSMSSPSNADSRASTTASSTLELQPAIALPVKEQELQEPSEAAMIFCRTASRSAPTCVAAFCQMHVCASSVCSWMHEKDAEMPSKISVAVEKQSKPASFSCVAAFCQMHVCDASVCSSMHSQEVEKEIATETPADAATTGSRFCQMHVCAAAVCRWMHEQ
eukprot:TRINITY_DN916_c0_g1_i1.p1 TRINITY_DN916_c0_g1~~TRINITY_DN916_c0_g1_i1.p1  ORF type:complete len:527 (-),score=125.65 TRINITY_DN916_c0_g1_i1:587-2167(-)